MILFEKIFITIFMTLIFILLLFFVFVVYKYVSLEKITLNKKDWNCTKYVNSIIYTNSGKIIIPVNVQKCSMYELKFEN